MSGIEKTVTALLATIAFVGALVFFIGRGKIHRQEASTPATSEQVILPPEPMEPPALAALEAFFEAPDLTTKAAHVRNSSKVLPMMNDYYQRREHPFPTMGRVSKAQVTNDAGIPLVLFEVEPFSGPRYPVAVAWDGRRFVVDWESLTAYGTIDWSEFLERQPKTPNTLRVYIQAASESEQIPNTPPGFTAFRIEHRDSPQPVIAQASKELALSLNPLVMKRRAPVTLELTWKSPDGNGVPVPEIIRLIATGWSP